MFLSKKGKTILILLIVFIVSAIAVFIDIKNNKLDNVVLIEKDTIQKNCSVIDEVIYNKIEQSNYCLQDSDCIVKESFDCPFGCYNLFNNTVDLNQLEDEVNAHAKSCYDGAVCEACISTPDQKDVVCQKNRCVVKQAEELPKVVTDKTEYQEGETVNIDIQNKTFDTINIRLVSVDKLIGDKWSVIDGDVSCPCDAECKKELVSLSVDEIKNFRWDQSSGNIMLGQTISGEGELQCVKAEIGKYRIKMSYNNYNPENLIKEIPESFIAYSDEFEIKPKLKDNNCESLEQEINNKIEQVNYCDIDNDCVTKKFGCPFGCDSYVNKDASILEINNLRDSFQSCPGSRCENKCPTSVSSVCVNNKCISENLNLKNISIKETIISAVDNCTQKVESFLLQTPDVFESVEKGVEWCNDCESKDGIPSLSYDSGVFCNAKTTDSGKKCIDSGQCKGLCLSENENLKEGTCSKTETVLGCVFEMTNGEAMEICFD